MPKQGEGDALFQHMTAAQEAAFDRKSEAHFRGQRELQCGRDFRWNKPWNRPCGDNCVQAEQRFKDNFDQIQWDNPRPPNHELA